MESKKNDFLVGVMEFLTRVTPEYRELVVELCAHYGVTVEQFFTAFLHDLVDDRSENFRLISKWFCNRFYGGSANGCYFKGTCTGGL